MSLHEFDALVAEAKSAARVIASRFDGARLAPMGADDVSNCGSPNCGLTAVANCSVVDVANCGVTDVANCGVVDVANCGVAEL